MRAEEIQRHLKRQPFQPFRLFLSNGMSYDIRHPELMIVGRRNVIIALDSGEDEIPERFADCDPVHVNNIEPIDGAKRKGPKTKRR